MNRLQTIQEAAARARAATLPPQCQWGADAMESFNFGKECAARAIETMDHAWAPLTPKADDNPTPAQRTAWARWCDAPWPADPRGPRSWFTDLPVYRPMRALGWIQAHGRALRKPDAPAGGPTYRYKAHPILKPGAVTSLGGIVAADGYIYFKGAFSIPAKNADAAKLHGWDLHACGDDAYVLAQKVGF